MRSATGTEIGDQIEPVAAEQLADHGDDLAGAPGRAIEFEARRAWSKFQQFRFVAVRLDRADAMPRSGPRDMAEQPCPRGLAVERLAVRLGNRGQVDPALLERERLATGEMNALDSKRRRRKIVGAIGDAPAGQRPAILLAARGDDLGEVGTSSTAE